MHSEHLENSQQTAHRSRGSSRTSGPVIIGSLKNHRRTIGRACLAQKPVRMSARNPCVSRVGIVSATLPRKKNFFIDGNQTFHHCIAIFFPSRPNDRSRGSPCATGCPFLSSIGILGSMYVLVVLFGGGCGVRLN